MAILLLSQGVPMITAGDEVLRSQQGNNNTWCQNNPLGWFDWTLPERNSDMLRFTREMIAFRRRHPCLMHTRFLTGEEREGHRFPDISWHGELLHRPPWDDPGSRLLVFTLGALEPWEADLHVIMNMEDRDVHLPLPELPGLKWYRAIDTARDAEANILRQERQEPHRATACRVVPHSVVVFEGR